MSKEIYAMIKGEKVVLGNVNSKKQFTFREDIDMSIVSKKTMERLEDMYEIYKPKHNMNKPPIGLKPKKYHSLERLNEVRSAIVRYVMYDDKLPIPVEWIEEYNELIRNNDRRT